jgi:hypothetical protein
LTALWISPANLAQNAAKELMACFGLCFAREIAFLQIAHVLDEDYVPLNWNNFFVLSGIICNSFLHSFGVFIVNEYFLLLGMIVFAFFSYVHLVYFSIREITEELDIHVFSVKKKGLGKKKN